jgi:parallel beta-helix repeat protein
VTVTGNRIYGNSTAGIMLEVSSHATVSGNAVWENGWGSTAWGWGAGILVSSSSSVAVSGNTVAWNADGISIISQNRSDAPGSIVDDTVRDNTIVMAPQPGDGSDVMGLAWLEDWNGVLFASSSHNSGAGDDFWWAGAAPRCAYDWNGCYDTLGAFNGTAGEQGGALLSSATRAARLAAAGIPSGPQHH